VVKKSKTDAGLEMPFQDNMVAYIPFGYHAGFIDYLAANRNLFQIITYDDLMWQDERAVNGTYPNERKAWEHAMREGRLDPNKIYVLIQHDVDTCPERTLNLLKYEASRGILSNVMIFNKRVNRKKLATTGELEYTPYELDFELLRNLQAKGFVIGYHSNAYEQSQYDEQRALQIFRQDVESLRRQLPIRYFSPHGGAPGPGGLNNYDLRLSAEMLEGLTWVHNKVTPYFKLNYSDGAINSPKLDPAKRDIRDFVRQWQPGNRYRLLTHPQYYHNPCKRAPRLSGSQWYEEIWAAYHSDRGHEVWTDVKPAVAGSKDECQALRRQSGNVYRWVRRILNLGRRR
jgi:hypothetical protein